jgi:hypothetical protein
MDDFPLWLKIVVYSIIGLTCVGLVAGFLQTVLTQG